MIRGVAIVTGSTSGIGRGVAESFASDGYRVVVNSAHSAEEGQKFAASLPDAIYVKADVCCEDDIKRVVEETLNSFGRIDVVVNNAATTRHVPFSDLDGVDDDLWHGVIATNVLGPWYMSRAAAPALRETKGSIINIGSIVGIIAGGSSIPYAVSKAALHHLTRTLAIALAPDVRVNAIAPGFIETAWTARFDGSPILARTPLQRAGQPEDVARAVTLLVATQFATGQVLAVDGGVTLG